MLRRRLMGDGEYEEVDLGLPSGLKWATKNVGAEDEYDKTPYFVWCGNTTGFETNTGGNWNDYPYGDASGANHHTKYATNSVILPEDDIARILMGGRWRTPTYEEFLELIRNTGWRNETINGVPCVVLTGPNGNTITFPLNRGSSSSNGYYWTSTSYSPDARYYQFSTTPSYCGFNTTYKYCRFNIRGVR